MTGFAAVIGVMIGLCATTTWLTIRLPRGGVDTTNAHTGIESHHREGVPRAMSVWQAHRIMQAHRNCHLDECPRKRAAYRTLVDAGRLRPDSGRVV